MIYKIYLGSVEADYIHRFTGYINKIMIYSVPQTPIEILDNAFRSPVKYSKFYEPNLEFYFITENDLEVP